MWANKVTERQKSDWNKSYVIHMSDPHYSSTSKRKSRKADSYTFSQSNKNIDHQLIVKQINVHDTKAINLKLKSVKLNTWDNIFFAH